MFGITLSLSMLAALIVGVGGWFLVGWWVLIYVAGMVVTFFVNMYDMVFITNPFMITFNVLFWPIMLPVVIAAHMQYR
jgi:hypothetical protein